MTLNEHKKEVEALLLKAKRNCDWFKVTECEQLLSDLNKLTDAEYSSYIKVKRMYAISHIKPIIGIKDGNEVK